MRRRLLIAVLALGTIGGFGSGIASLACHHADRRDAFERHVAQVCVDAARRADRAEHEGHRGPPPSDRY